MVLCFCYESPLFFNILSCEVKKQDEYDILGCGRDGSQCFDLMNHCLLPLYAFHVRLTCGTRPF